MKIVNVSRFMKSILVLAILIILPMMISQVSFSHTEIEYKIISVTRGDTLWSIATEEEKSNPYYYGKDIREIIQNIKEINNLTKSNIYEGQKLQVAKM